MIGYWPSIYWPRIYWPLWLWGDPNYKADVALAEALVYGVALSDAAVSAVSISTATR
jgi:hypothetical protein